MTMQTFPPTYNVVYQHNTMSLTQSNILDI